MERIERWKARARLLKTEIHALWLACQDPRVPRRARLLAALVAAYALSPIDLIPDFIPVLGYVDDMILLPLGILLVVKMIPADVLADCRARAKEASLRKGASGAVLGAVMVVVLWVAIAAATYVLVIEAKG
ncbi:YkvA family protein [uncultured Desulfosarcina sp.]|uniref:YkvA family protein n=1 Tax=uncultured Desulfosarcina sp. TaxID=218289 RepID=UPI003749BC6A